MKAYIESPKFFTWRIRVSPYLTAMLIGLTIIAPVHAEESRIDRSNENRVVASLVGSADTDLELGLTVSDGQPVVGQTITFTLTLTNNSVEDAEGVLVRIPGVVGLSFQSESGPGDYDDGTKIWTLGSLTAGASVAFQLNMKVLVLSARTLYAEVSAASPADVDSTPNNSSTTEDDDASVDISPRRATEIFTPTSYESTSFSTLFASPYGPAGKTGGDVSDYLFAGSTDGGLHRSSDGGENWPRVGLKDKVIRAMSISTLTGAIYVGDYGTGMYRSTDDGLVFSGINTNLTNLKVISSVIDEDPPRTGSDGDVYIGTDGGGVFVSTDDGASWNAVNTGLPSGAVVRALIVEKDGGPGSKEAVYAGLLGKGVHTLNQNTSTWSAINGSAPGSELLGDKYVYALTLANTGTLLAGAGDGIYRTTDGGTTWTSELAGVPIRTFATYFDAATSTRYIFAGTDGEFIYVSTDDGATWKQQLIGIDDRTVETILMTDDGIAFAGTATQGIFRSDDFGTTWYRVSSFMQNATIQAMTFNNDGELYVGTYGYGVFFTDDALNFTRVNTGLDNHWVFSLAYSTGDALFAGTWNKGVYRSLDDARTWQFVGLPGRNVYDLAVDGAYTIYAATDRGEVARSVDNGLSWHQIGVATTAIYALIVDPNNSNVIYAGTFGQGTYKSTDGGSTFTKTNMADTHVFDFAFDPINPGHLWAATSTGPMRSTDGGTTWTSITFGLSVVDSRAITFTSAGIPLVGTWGGGVSMYDSTIPAWVEYGLTRMPIMAFAISPVSGEVFAGTDGLGVFRGAAPVAATGSEIEGISEVPSEYGLSQNFPNPFNPTTAIEFGLPASEHVRLAVYDMVGREIRVLANGAFSAGRHQVTLEAADLPSGVYLYRLEAGGKSFAKTMILMK